MLDNTLTRFADALERIATALENMQAASTNVVNVSGPSAEELQETIAKTLKETTLAAKTVLKDMDTQTEVGKSPKAETPAASATQTVAEQKTTPADSQESQAVQPQEPSADSAKEADSSSTSSETKTSESPAQNASEEKAKEVSVDEARAALRTYSQTQGTQNALEILSKLGAKAISDLDAAGRAQLLEMVQG